MHKLASLDQCITVIHRANLQSVPYPGRDPNHHEIHPMPNANSSHTGHRGNASAFSYMVSVYAMVDMKDTPPGSSSVLDSKDCEDDMDVLPCDSDGYVADYENQSRSSSVQLRSLGTIAIKTQSNVFYQIVHIPTQDPQGSENVESYVQSKYMVMVSDEELMVICWEMVTSNNRKVDDDGENTNTNENGESIAVDGSAESKTGESDEKQTNTQAGSHSSSNSSFSQSGVLQLKVLHRLPHKHGQILDLQTCIIGGNRKLLLSCAWTGINIYDFSFQDKDGKGPQVALERKVEVTGPSGGVLLTHISVSPFTYAHRNIYYNGDGDGDGRRSKVHRHHDSSRVLSSLQIQALDQLNSKRHSYHLLWGVTPRGGGSGGVLDTLQGVGEKKEGDKPMKEGKDDTGDDEVREEACVPSEATSVSGIVTQSGIGKSSKAYDLLTQANSAVLEQERHKVITTAISTEEAQIVQHESAFYLIQNARHGGERNAFLGKELLHWKCVNVTAVSDEVNLLPKSIINKTTMDDASEHDHDEDAVRSSTKEEDIKDNVDAHALMAAHGSFKHDWICIDDTLEIHWMQDL
jgi:hypothetical protein